MIAVPVPNPTMPCFAGDRVYITTGLPKEEEMREALPHAGGLFAMKTEVAGVPVGRFADRA